MRSLAPLAFSGCTVSIDTRIFAPGSARSRRSDAQPRATSPSADVRGRRRVRRLMRHTGRSTFAAAVGIRGVQCGSRVDSLRNPCVKCTVNRKYKKVPLLGCTSRQRHRREVSRRPRPALALRRAPRPPNDPRAQERGRARARASRGILWEGWCRQTPSAREFPAPKTQRRRPPRRGAGVRTFARNRAR